MEKSRKCDVVVVGAGPSGLILARRLAQAGVDFTVLERNETVGGIWNIDAPNSPMYESAHFISSRTVSGFPDFPMPDHYPDYPNHKQLFEYIRAYATHFDLLKYVEFNKSVQQAVFNENHWTINLESGEEISCRYLICANGVTWEPNTVEWEGAFNGEIKHSVRYKSVSELAHKRVLVVGAGNSGVDIACDASFAAEQAFLSVRRGYHFVPKHIMGKPVDVFSMEGPKLPEFLQQKIFSWMLRFINGDLTRYGLPKPDHKLFQTHPIMNTQILHYLAHGDCVAKPDVKRLDGDYVEFVDGSREKIDVIITATGYAHSVPFLSEGVLQQKNGRPDLYLNIFPRNQSNLAILGFIEFASAAYYNFDAMAELIVADVIGKASGLQAMKQTHFPDLTGGHQYLKTERNANYVDVGTYLETLNEVKQKAGV